MVDAVEERRAGLRRVFQQSSFGTFALSQERYTVKVRSDAPLDCSARSPAAARPAPAPC